MVANGKDQRSFQAERGAHLHCSEELPSDSEPSNVTSSFLIVLFLLPALGGAEARVFGLLENDTYVSL